MSERVAILETQISVLKKEIQSLKKIIWGLVLIEAGQLGANVVPNFIPYLLTTIGL